jgi:hypothetical protein
MNAKSQNCQNCQKPTWLEERKQLEEVFGRQTYYQDESGVTARKGTRSYLKNVELQKLGSLTITGPKEFSETIQGATLKPLPVYGLLPLLATRSKTFKQLWIERPDTTEGIYDIIGKPYSSIITPSDFIDAALWPEESLERSKALLGHCMALSPDWTLACISELRATYAKRLEFMPELIMMAFKRSEMLSNDELGAELGQMFPERWGFVNITDRRKDLRKKLESLVSGK